MKLIYVFLFPLVLTACGSSNSRSDSRQTDDISSSNFMKQISAGLNYICGITIGNVPKCIGEDNNYGQQGIGNTNANYIMTQVQNLPQASFLSSGFTNTCFLNNGNAFCSGDNSLGELGDGSFTNSTVPVQVRGISNIQQISVGNGSACALRNDGAVFCWGMSFDHKDPLNQKNSNIPVQINTGLKFKSISNNANSFEYCGISNDSYIYCWLNESLYPEKINGLSNIKSVTSGGGFNCALNESGKAYCWGINESGQLGNGRNETSGNPVEVLNVNNFSSIFSFQETTCGITTDGKTYCWGRGFEGQLGNGSTSNSNIPVQVNTKVQFTQIAGAFRGAYAIDQNGKIYCWGTTELTTLLSHTDLNPVLLKF